MATTHLSGPLVVATTGSSLAGTTTLNTATVTTLSVTGHATLEGVTSTGATGTGKLVFDGTPTLTTPIIGAATGTSVTVTGALASRSATATPAAASAVPMVVGGSALVGVYFGTGNPNTALTAPQGSLFLSTNGNTTATRLFINSNGTTGWVAITTAS
jgi:hypothetical protein